MTVVCTTCNAKNPDDAVFCEECGIELTPEPVSSISATPSTGDAQSGSPADSQEPFVEEVAAGGDESLAAEPLDDESTTLESPASVGESLEPVSHEIASASLTLIEFGNPTNTVIPLNFSPVAVGKFDPAQGPIDVDLSHLVGNEYISRRHAELYFDQGWAVRDLGSTNGVFIRRKDQSDFLPRLQTTFKLESGDEIAFGNMRFLFQETGD